MSFNIMMNMMKEQSEKENKTETEKNINFLVEFVFRGTEELSETERELIAFARLEKMGFRAPKEIKKEVREIKKSGKFGKYLLWGGMGLAAGVGMGYLAGNDAELFSKPEEKKITGVQPEPITGTPKKTATYQEAVKSMERFDRITYEKLSANGRRAYEFHREKDPTPKKTYFILDKTRTILYEISPENKLIFASSVIIGSALGEAENTSVEGGGGIETTPSGIYVISKYAGLDQKDIVLYEEEQFYVFGISIAGDKTQLGFHQTYPGSGEFEKRTAALNQKNTVNPRRTRGLSDGCVNWPKEYFGKYVFPNIRGDGSELMYILPDTDPTTGKEPAFEPEKIIGRIGPIMKEVQEIEKEERNKVDKQAIL